MATQSVFSQGSRCQQPRPQGPHRRRNVRPFAVASDSAASSSAAARTSSVSTRRDTLLGLSTTLAYAVVSPALAQDAPAAPADAPQVVAPAAASSSTGSRKVYLMVTIDNKPAGKIVFETLPGAAKVGAQRFTDLCIGKEGVAYRLSKFDYISENYLRVEGVRQLSYSADGVSPIAGGESIAALEEEMEVATLKHTEPYLVSLVVKEDKERPISEKLVAVNGKLVTVTNQAGEAPNGTSFIITKGAAPELDATNLVVARVVDGFDTLERISDVPIFKNNEASPFFQAAKVVGDKRATVAEKGFNRPLFRVVVQRGGAVA